MRFPFFGKAQVAQNDSVDVPALVKEYLATTTIKGGDKEKFFDALGGFLQFTRTSLSDEKTVSSKLLEANKEWVYRNNDVIAQEVSKIEFELYQVGLEGGEIAYREVDQHPLLDALDRFNSATTKSDAIYTTQSHKKLTGDAFWLLDKNGKAIQNIYTLPPDKIELKLGDPTQTNGKLVESYEYKDVIDGKKIEQVYQPDQIIHFKKPNPRNQFRGYGAVEAMAETIDHDNLASSTQGKFFKQGAIGNFILSTDSKLTQEQIKRLNAEFRAGLTGFKNAFKLMILGGGLKPTNIGYSNKDLQFLDLLEWYRDKIMIAFGNTKASLGIVDDVNRASFDGSHIGWLSGTVKPDMDSIVNTLNEFLVPMFGDNLILGYKNPIPEDRTNDITEAVQLKGAGIIMINEARNLLGYEEVDGGNIFAPTGAVSTPNGDNNGEDDNNKKQFKRVYRKLKVKSLPSGIAHFDIKPVLRAHGVFTQRQVNRDFKEAVKPLVRKMLKDSKGKSETSEPLHHQFTNDQVMAYYQKQIHIVDVLEKRFYENVLRILQKIQNSALHNLETEIGTIKSLRKSIAANKALFSPMDIKLESELNLLPLLMQEVTLAGQEAYRLIGADDVYIPFVSETVKQNVTKFTDSMIATDQQVLTDIIRGGIDEGKSVPEIRQVIQDKFGQYTKGQAERITRTEVLRAGALATEDAFIQSSVVVAKQWLVAPGADAECMRYSGKIVKLKGNFYESDNEFQDGNPPIHPNCRCVLIPVLVDSKAFIPAPFDEKMAFKSRIDELEAKIGKSEEEYKKLKLKTVDDASYILKLEEFLGVNDG